MATFSWAAAADVGMQLLGAFGKASASRTNARLAAAQAAAANTVREANNTAQRAQAGLAARIQSINNQRNLEAGGAQIAALELNRVRANEAFSRRDVARGLQDLEAAGRAAANAAVAGVGGGSVEAFNRTQALRAAILDQAAEDQQADQNYDFAVARAGLTTNMARSIDQRPIFAQQDFGVNIAPTQTGTGTFSTLVQALSDKQTRASANVLLNSLARPASAPEVEADHRASERAFANSFNLE